MERQNSTNVRICQEGLWGQSFGSQFFPRGVDNRPSETSELLSCGRRREIRCTLPAVENTANRSSDPIFRRRRKTVKFILNTVAAVLVAASAFAADTFVVDKAHSEALFQVRHLVSRVTGRFDDFSGTINVDRANPSVSSVEINIKTTSIDTGNENRDKDLRSPNFFEVDKYPEISFKSTSIKPTAKKDPY